MAPSLRIYSLYMLHSSAKSHSQYDATVKVNDDNNSYLNLFQFKFKQC